MRENILNKVNEVYKKENPSFFIKNISKKNKYLFKGTCGVGMNYFVGFIN